MPEAHYPFVPKSTKPLLPGHFWAVPLSDGRFACGRVIALQVNGNGNQNLRLFLAGLLDWVGVVPPSSDQIAGRRTLEQGQAHIKAITCTGGAILGHRALELDGIEPDYFLSESPGKNCRLQRGYEDLGKASRADQEKFDVFSTWGYSVIQVRAEEHFCHASPKRGRVSARQT